MKKFLSFLLVMICVMGFMSPVFGMKKTHAETSSNFIEDVIKNKQDILSVQTNNLPLASATKNNSPFNTNTKQMLEGYTITPRVDNYGQQKITFSVIPFSAEAASSVFVWVYFEEVLSYDLTFAFTSASNLSISWIFDGATLADMVDDGGKKVVPYGWKLFELKFANAVCDKEGEDFYDETFSTMTFSYKSPVSLSASVSAKGLSFYHVFKGDAYSETSQIVYYQKYSNFEVREDFASKLDGFYVGDDLKFNGIYDIFEYVVVGKYDLRNYSNLENYTWSIVLQNGESDSIAIKFGETYTFQDVGWYSINVKLAKVKGDNSEIVLNTSYSLYCDEFAMGSFANKSYFIYKDKETVISFKIADDFVFDDDISVSVAKEKIAEVVSCSEEDGMYHIKLNGLKTGNTKITVSGTGHRAGTTEIQEYSCQTTIYVSETGESSLSLTLTIIVFIAFCVGLVTFIVISFVKSRKFGVK